MKEMTVKELIEVLQTFDPELPVAYDKWSECMLLAKEDLQIRTLQKPRPDGWVHHNRKDIMYPTKQYLVFGA